MTTIRILSDFYSYFSWFNVSAQFKVHKQLWSLSQRMTLFNEAEKGDFEDFEVLKGNGSRHRPSRQMQSNSTDNTHKCGFTFQQSFVGRVVFQARHQVDKLPIASFGCACLQHWNSRLREVKGFIL